MSAANLDAIKKKYNFKEINVATWRDPSLSGDSGFPGAPYTPTYKVRYDALPEPTDDELSEDFGDGEDDETERENEFLLRVRT